MKSCFILFVIFSTSILAKSQEKISPYFENKSLRIDFYLAGNDKTEKLYWDKMVTGGIWPGNGSWLIDTLQYGDYLYELVDTSTSEALHNGGFSSLFREWQFTDEANEKERAFHQSIRIPLPLQPVMLNIYSRDNKNNLKKISDRIINPESQYISRDDQSFGERIPVLDNGHPHQKVDLVFLAEGYQQNEKEKFMQDMKRLTHKFFSVEPFKSMKSAFNVNGVFYPSEDSGTDLPGADTWRNTVLNSHFFTFGSERYLTTKKNMQVRNMAAAAAYDQIIILVNSEKYGGGGIYNHYTILTSDNEYSGFLLLHEFGHAFAGLGDEYYTNEVAYQDIYDVNSEPWQPNLTTLVNFETKWEHMMKDDTPIPTPETAEYLNSIGVYEGAGYVAENVYRPFQDCIMKSRDAKAFCPVCENKIREMILMTTK